MTEIIAIANQKGGVGKTTTAINLSAALSVAGKRVLAIDMDPQGNMTSGLGIDKDSLTYSVYELLIGECEVNECICGTLCEKLDIIPASVNLAGAEVELLDVDGREYILRDKVQELLSRYDFIIIDCPPALSMLTINALTTANSVLVPMQCEFYALEGLAQLMYTINLVKERLNNKLEISGIVFTMYDSRTNLSMQVVENVQENLNQHIYRTVIPRNVRLAEAPSHGLPINIYDPKCSGAEGYRRLAEEIIEEHRKAGRK